MGIGRWEEEGRSRVISPYFCFQYCFGVCCVSSSYKVSPNSVIPKSCWASLAVGSGNSTSFLCPGQHRPRGCKGRTAAAHLQVASLLPGVLPVLPTPLYESPHTTFLPSKYLAGTLFPAWKPGVLRCEATLLLIFLLFCFLGSWGRGLGPQDGVNLRG